MQELVWTLPRHQATVFALLRNVEMVLPEGELNGDLGVEVIEAIQSVTRDGMKLWLWIRSSLNSQALGHRVEATIKANGIVESWYEGWAPLHHEELSRSVLDALRSLDSTKFLLSVDDGVLQGQWGRRARSARKVVQCESGQNEAEMRNLLSGKSPYGLCPSMALNCAASWLSIL